MIGPSLRRARERAGFSQQQVADLADVSRATVNGLETGATRGNVRTLTRIAKALGTTAWELLRDAAEHVDGEPCERCER